MTAALRLSLLVLATTLAAGIVASHAASPPPAYAYAFSHAEHAARDPGRACVDCHDASATSTNSRPNLRTATCAQCHDDVPSIAPRAPRVDLPLAFPHAPHARQSCASCHAAAVTRDDDEKTAEHVVAVKSGACFACHADQDHAPRAPACVRCHGRDEKRERPASHDATWRAGHGDALGAIAGAIAFAPSAHGTSCTTCHRESSCKSCHRVERPADHGAVWGKRTHGVAASFDRQRCKTCHETGQCIGCHRTTEPDSHRGAWKATHGLVARGRSDASCATCHRSSFCIDCHRGGAR